MTNLTEQQGKGQNPDQNGDDLSGPLLGYTSDDEKRTFVVPKTLNAVTIWYPWNLNQCSAVSFIYAWSYFFVCVLTNYVPSWFMVAHFLFFRCLYNVWMGFVLHSQSHHNTWVKWFERLTSDKNSRTYSFIHNAARSALSKDAQYSPESTPSAFGAWLLWRHMVNHILLNDTVSYLALGVRFFEFPTEWTVGVYVQYSIGIAFGLANWFAKASAYRRIGEYSWYWGDFFFRVSRTLVFDGIFEIVPHPMYTIGYSVYYGYAMVARSWIVLLCGFAAHMLQLAFLFFVEEPHIQRIYPPTPKSPKIEEYGKKLHHKIKTKLNNIMSRKNKKAPSNQSGSDSETH